MSITTLNLDSLDIDLSENIVGTVGNPVLPGVAGRIAFAKDTNVLYFAEDDATWIRFFPQDSSSSSSSNQGGVVDSPGSINVQFLLTGESIPNGLYSVDSSNNSLGIYFSGTSSNPQAPSVVSFSTNKAAESVYLENVLSAVTPSSVLGNQVEFPESIIDPEWLAEDSDQEQLITLTLDIVEGDQVSVTVNGTDTTILASATIDATALTLTNALTLAHPAIDFLRTTASDSYARLIAVSAPMGDAVLTGGITDGSGSVEYSELLPGHKGAPMVAGSPGQIQSFKKFKEKGGKNLVVAPYKSPNYITEPFFSWWNYDLDTGEIDQDLVDLNSGDWAKKMSVNFAVGAGLQGSLIREGTNPFRFSPRITQSKYTIDGQLYMETGIQYWWTGVSGNHDEDHSKATPSIQNAQYGLVHGNISNANSICIEYQNGNFPTLSNEYLTFEGWEASKSVLDFGDTNKNPVFYSHNAISLGGATHKIFDRRAGYSYTNRHKPDNRYFMLGLDLTTSTSNVYFKYGPMGFNAYNIDYNSYGDKNHDLLYLHPGGGFWSIRATGYKSYYQDRGYSSDSAWGGMVDPYDWNWTDHLGYTSSTSGYLSGIGRRRTLQAVYNTGARDYAPTADSALFLSNDYYPPVDVSDEGGDLVFKYSYVTGHQRYSVGTTSSNRSIDYYGGMEPHATIDNYFTPVSKNGYKFWSTTTQDGNYRPDDPESNGKEFGNPNNSLTFADNCVIKVRNPSSPNSDASMLHNYLYKSKQWPFKAASLNGGGISSTWHSTVKQLKRGLWSWGPDDDFTIEFIYKNTPSRPLGVSNSYADARGINNTAVQGLHNNFNQPPGGIWHEDDLNGTNPQSFENWTSNPYNTANYQKFTQGTLFAIGSAYTTRWLAAGFMFGRFCVANERPKRQQKAGEYPATDPFLVGETLLEDEKWYHLAVVKDSSANSLSLYVNGKLDGKASLVADVSAHGAAYNGGVYYTDTVNGVSNLPVYNKVVPSYVSTPEQGFGAFSWMGEYWGFPVQGNAKYVPQADGSLDSSVSFSDAENHAEGVNYSMGYLNPKKVHIDSSNNYHVAPVEEGKNMKVNYRGDFREYDSAGYGHYSAEDVDDLNNTAGGYAHDCVVQIGMGYSTYNIEGKVGSVHVANKAIYSADFSSSYTIDEDMGIIAGPVPQKINESIFLFDASTAPDDSWDYGDVAYFDLKASLSEKPYGNVDFTSYFKIGDFESHLTIPGAYQYLSSMHMKSWDTFQDSYASTHYGNPLPHTILHQASYINLEGSEKNKNIDSVRDGVRSSLIAKYLKV